jgi:hypothetical protein
MSVVVVSNECFDQPFFLKCFQHLSNFYININFVPWVRNPVCEEIETMLTVFFLSVLCSRFGVPVYQIYSVTVGSPRSLILRRVNPIVLILSFYGILRSCDGFLETLCTATFRFLFCLYRNQLQIKYVWMKVCFYLQTQPFFFDYFFLDWASILSSF